MTLEEAIELAEQGDLDSMWELGKYYHDQNEINGQYEWFVRAAEGGLEIAYIPAAICTDIYVHIKRKVSGGDAIHDSEVAELDRALRWIELARQNGEETDAGNGIIRNRALCAYEASKKPGSAISQTEAIAYLKEAHALPGESPVIEVYLALALSLVGESLPSADQRLCFSLHRRCVGYAESDVPDINFGVLDASLGNCYLLGIGCPVNEDAAYKCFVRAGQRGFDCSDMLRNFRKKLFGGYEFRR